MTLIDQTNHVTHDYPRDMLGYANHPPHAQWPNKAKIAVQFVLNYEEGGERHILHGDDGSEQFLSEISGADSYPARHLSMDSIYEYGSRVGFWRIQQEFAKRHLPMTIFAVAMALQRNPLVVEAIWTATTLLDKFRLFFLHRREHYEWTTIHPRI